MQRARDPALFPASVAQHSITFSVADAADAARSFPGITLPAALERAAPKRRAEYLAGRYCARQALRVCAPDAAEVVVGIGPRREPLWPPGVVGAITHTGDYASVAVARAADVGAIGLDVEPWIEVDELASMLGTIASPAEVDALEQSTGWSRRNVVTAVFSAKETVFKCLYPQVQRYFDFREAEVTLLEERGGVGRFAARLLSNLTERHAEGSVVEGRFERSETAIVTAMTLLP